VNLSTASQLWPLRFGRRLNSEIRRFCDLLPGPCPQQTAFDCPCRRNPQSRPCYRKCVDSRRSGTPSVGRISPPILGCASFCFIYFNCRRMDCRNSTAGRPRTLAGATGV